jgi:hypothetical protein
MTFTLYAHDIKPKMTTKLRGKPVDKDASHKQSQKEYYKRRGCFLNYRNKVARLVGLDIKMLSHIQSVEALEKWSHDYILETIGIDLKDNCVPYIIYVLSKTNPK